MQLFGRGRVASIVSNASVLANDLNLSYLVLLTEMKTDTANYQKCISERLTFLN